MVGHRIAGVGRIMKARLRPLAGAILAVLAIMLSAPGVRAALPEPVLSRSLDAILLPIDDAARKQLSLTAGDQGALVLATGQGGVAEVYGIRPGDIITSVSGLTFAWADEIDVIVWALLNNKTFDFVF